MKRSAASDGRQLVILTGLSGSGKSTVLKTFEDLGYYCVDNLPVELIPTFSELHFTEIPKIERAALLVDAREGDQLEAPAGDLSSRSGETFPRRWCSSRPRKRLCCGGSARRAGRIRWATTGRCEKA